VVPKSKKEVVEPTQLRNTGISGAAIKHQKGWEVGSQSIPNENPWDDFFIFTYMKTQDFFYAENICKMYRYKYTSLMDPMVYNNALQLYIYNAHCFFYVFMYTC